MKIRCGTRGSPLALAQADEIARRLLELDPALEIERVIIHTDGDRFAQVPETAPVEKAAPENVKAMFVKEIEEALLEGSIDFAVHSAKDLPGELPNLLEIAAYPEREDPRDAFIGGPNAPNWELVPTGSVIGTSSLRRQIQFKIARPGITFTPLRGNVETRIKKMQEGKVAALILAQAGLKRLKIDDLARQILPPDVMIPAPGQGALALEARSSRKDVLELLAPLEHAKTRIEVECERLFLKAMGGGCSMPLGAFAQADIPADRNGLGTVKFSVFWSDLEGKNPIRRSGSCSASPERISAFVLDIAEQIRNSTDANSR